MENEKSGSNQYAEQEYECQQFTFDRKYLKDSLKAAVEDHIHRQVQFALENLTEALGLSDDQQNAVSEKLGRIDKFLCANAVQPLERINEGIDEHMSIPRYLTLPEDTDYGTQNSADLEALRLETDAARNRALTAGATARLLQRELDFLRDPVLLNARAAAEACIRAAPPVPLDLPRLDELLAVHSNSDLADNSNYEIFD